MRSRKYREAQDKLVSYAYGMYGLYDRQTAADRVDDRLYQLIEEYSLNDREVLRLINQLNKIVCTSILCQVKRTC